MTTVHDVAAYILAKQGAMSAMKLQKLCYYSQAWSLVWDEQPLFPEHIEAWANGPVVRELYGRHRGQYSVATWPAGQPGVLTPDESETVDAVLRTYGKLTAQQLSDLTHSEMPWRLARGATPPSQRSSAVITPESMQAFYSSLQSRSDTSAV